MGQWSSSVIQAFCVASYVIMERTSSRPDEQKMEEQKRTTRDAVSDVSTSDLLFWEKFL